MFVYTYSGVHHKKQQCDPRAAANLIDNGIQKYQTLLFPDRLRYEPRTGKKIKLKKGNGGWGDVRDHQLCLNFTQMVY